MRHPRDQGYRTGGCERTALPISPPETDRTWGKQHPEPRPGTQGARCRPPILRAGTGQYHGQQWAPCNSPATHCHCSQLPEAEFCRWHPGDPLGRLLAQPSSCLLLPRAQPPPYFPLLRLQSWRFSLLKCHWHGTPSIADWGYFVNTSPIQASLNTLSLTLNLCRLNKQKPE